ncbi:MAG: hypothetical protein RR521_07445 [Clostridia bacterium]
MQIPTQNQDQSELPPSQSVPSECKKRRRHAGAPARRGRFSRFLRGYLMLVGTLTTFYVLIQLLVLLFVEIGKWMPTLMR